MTSIVTILLALACLALLLIVKRLTVGYNSFTCIFIAFFALYGLTVPLDDVFGLPSLNPLYPSPHATGRFLLHFSLALAGLTVGLLGALSVMPRSSRAVPPTTADAAPRPLFLAALALAALASLFELINLQRIGGLAAIGFGKAIYQSKVDELALTLPSYIVGDVAIAAMALVVACKWDAARGAVLTRLAWFSAALAPAFALAVLLTRRTELIAWILIAFVGATWTRPLRRITWTLAILVVAAYALSPALLATRAQYALLSSGWWDQFRRELNPGNGEFATPFGMFNEYTTRLSEAPFRWGRTYVDGLASAVPGRLWPGEKPKQIDIEARDALFPQYRQGASLESAGFSSLLEAAVNFGTWGVAPVFAVFGVIMGLLETLRTRFRPIVAPLFYLSLLPIAQTFHRSAFGPAVLSVGVMIVLALGAFFAVYLPIASRAK
jgi:hypothetical protein